MLVKLLAVDKEVMAMARDMQREHVYIAIDLKSFYASVECAARGLDPLTTHLVVADETRTDRGKTTLEWSQHRARGPCSWRSIDRGVL